MFTLAYWLRSRPHSYTQALSPTVPHHLITTVTHIDHLSTCSTAAEELDHSIGWVTQSPTVYN